MTPTRALVHLAAAIGIALPVGIVVFDALRGWPDGALRSVYAPIVVVFAVVGWLIAVRRPGNVVGALCLVFAAVFSWYLPVDVLASAPDPSAAVRVLAVLSSASDAPMFMLMGWMLIHFPDGRLPSPGWRWTVWLGAAAIPIGIVSGLLTPGPIIAFAWLDNPLGVAGFPHEVGTGFAYLTVLVLLLAGAAAMIRRFRAGGPVVRAQVKWVAAASVLLVVTEIGNLATFNPLDPYAQPWWLLAATASAALIPIAIAVAILRYRLYEIDRIISRGVAWAVVSGMLVAVFGGSILLLQGVLGGITQGDTLAVAASTLVAAALFQPLRRRVQDAVDRRFNRARVDAQRAVDQFAARVREDPDLGTVHRRLLAAATGAVHPRGAAVWIRRDGR